MTAIDFYLDPVDGERLLHWLSRQPDIRFLAHGSDQPPHVDEPPAQLLPGSYALFHTSYPTPPSRPMPTAGDRGLTSELYGLMGIPVPGPASRLERSHPSIFDLLVAYESQEPGTEIPLSSVGWIGRRYEPEGLRVTPEADAWWRRFRRWVRANGQPVSRSGALEAESGGPRAWAFPAALERLRAGASRAGNVDPTDGDR